MSTVVQDLRYGIRLLVRTPGFTVVAVLTLALGVTATTTILGWMNATLLDPIPGVTSTARLVSVLRGEYTTNPMPPLSYPDFIDLRRASQTSAELLAYHDNPIFYTGERAPRRGYAAVVSSNYFELLGVRAALGRTFLPAEDEVPDGAPVTVIGADLWRDRFGQSPKVVGRTIEVNRRSYTIVGVAPDGFIGAKTGIRVDLWIPLSMDRAVFGGNRIQRRDVQWLNVVGRLRPGVERRGAQAAVNVAMRAIALQYPESHMGPQDLALIPLWRSPFGANGYLAASLPVLLGIGAVVLLLACANVANLLLVRSLTRQREMAIRLSIGATRWRLARQFVTESIALGLAGGLVAAVITGWTADSLASFIPPTTIPIALNGRFDARLLAITLALSMVACACAGLLPAMRTSRTEPATVLKQETSGASIGLRRGRLLRGLVVLQVALSVVLLVSAGLLVRSLLNAERVHPGFDVAGVALASIELQAPGFSRDETHGLEQRLVRAAASLPGVTHVTLADWVPLTFSRQSEDVLPDGYVPRLHESMDVRSAFVGPRYFETMRIAMRDGRDLTDHDIDGQQRVCVVDRAFVDRYWPAGRAVGRQLRARGNTWLVVGVAAGTRHQRLHEEVEPMVYFPLLQAYRGTVTLHVRTSGNPDRLLVSLERLIRNVDARLPVFNVTTLERSTRLGSLFERLAGTFAGTLGLVALGLAAVGLYGVLAFSTRQRAREMAIRLAVGAQPVDAFTLVMRDGLVLVGNGLALGLLASTALAGALRSLLVGVTAFDVPTYATAVGAIAIVAALASSIPAWRAARAEPSRALRDG